MMNREQFYNFMRQSVQDIFNKRGVEGTVQLEKVVKINDQVLTGLIIRDNAESGSPIVYLNDKYDKYHAGYPLSCMAEEVADILDEARNPNIEFIKLMDYDKARDNLSFRLVDIEGNKQWLEDKVWEPMGDFAKVCYLDLGKQKNGCMILVMTMSHMAHMGATKEQMIEDAQKNLDNVPPVFMNIAEMMAGLTGIHENTPADMGQPLYVLTNDERYLGAAMIARKDVLKEIGDKLGCDYYVLPSSIHEVMIVPVNAGFTVEMLNALVKEVNATEVSVQDKLSDKAQYYDREKEQLRNVRENTQAKKSQVAWLYTGDE